MINIYGIAIIVVVIIFIQHVRKRSRHPPGPLGLPFVGLLPFQLMLITFANYLPKISQLKVFKQMKEKYGDFWSMEMGGQRIVTFASFDILVEALGNNGHLFEGRPTNEVFDMLSEKQGILLSNGKLHKDNRQMMIKALREFGMGRKEMENHISEEVNLLIEHLTEQSSRPIHGSVAVIKTISNIITRLIFNDYNRYGDPLFNKFIKDLEIAFRSDVIETKCGLFPKFFCTKLARYMFSDVDKYFKAWSDLRLFVVEKCEKVRPIQNANVEPSRIFDYFWRYRYQDEPEIEEERKINEIYHLLEDFYFSGIETTNTFITFCFLMLGRYPDVQMDLRSEIQNLTDDYRDIDMNMRKDCPKFLSFVDEVHRFCCLVPKFPRRITKKHVFRGYQLYPEDIIFSDFGTITRDKLIFENPDLFDPYRFMDESKTRYVPNKYIIPFGYGKRSCIGESIASMEVFLILTRIILEFSISLIGITVNNFDEILEGKVGFVHGPLEYQMKLDKLQSV